MLSFFKSFKKFREKYPDFGGKGPFKRHYKKIRVRKGEDIENFIIKCLLARQLSNQKKSFVCDIKISNETVDIYDIEEEKKYIVSNYKIPEEIKSSIIKLNKFLENI